MTKLIIFDIDGTIVDAYEAIKRSLNHTLIRMGYPCCISASSVRRAIGYGDRNFIERFFEEKDVDAALHIYREHHKMSLLKHSRVMPGVIKVLNLLKKSSLKLAVASNRPPRYSLILLRHLKLAGYFDMIVCARDEREIKPSPKILLKILKRLKIDKSQALYVGDMALDVEAGRNAGIRMIAVTGGSSSRPELKKARPFKIISRLQQILKML